MDKIFGKLNYQVKPITQQLNEETNVEFIVDEKTNTISVNIFTNSTILGNNYKVISTLYDKSGSEVDVEVVNLSGNKNWWKGDKTWLFVKFIIMTVQKK